MAKFELNAEKRDVKGKGASRRLRREGKVPAVMYGAGKSAVSLTLDHNSIFHQLKNESFYSSILTVKVGAETEQAILRDIQMHPYKPRIAHMDLQRISATEKLHMKVPLHFINQDIAPGVKQQGGLVSHLMNEVDVSCLPKDLPEYLIIDMGEVVLNQSIHLSDLKLPDGVTITSLAHGNDLAVATITTVRVEVEETPAAAAPAEGTATPAAGAAAPGTGAAAPAAEAAKAEPAKKEGGKK